MHGITVGLLIHTIIPGTGTIGTALIIRISVSPSGSMILGSISAAVRRGTVPHGAGIGDGAIRGVPAGGGHGIPGGIRAGTQVISRDIRDIVLRVLITDGLQVLLPDVVLQEAIITADTVPPAAPEIWDVPLTMAITIPQHPVIVRLMVPQMEIPMELHPRTIVVEAETASTDRLTRLRLIPTAVTAVLRAIMATAVHPIAIAVPVAVLTATAAVATEAAEAVAVMVADAAPVGELHEAEGNTNIMT